MGSKDPAPSASAAAKDLAVGKVNRYASTQNNPALRDVMAKYSAGQMSKADALGQIHSLSGGGGKELDPALYDKLQAAKSSYEYLNSDYLHTGTLQPGDSNDAFQKQDKQHQVYEDLQRQWDNVVNNEGGLRDSALTNAFYTDASTGSMLASDFVRNDGLTKGLFGAGGIQDQAQSRYGQLNSQLDQDRSSVLSLGSLLDEDRQSLMGRDQSYGLTDTDLAAYGQAAGNITRQFANSEQSLAQHLADRGLTNSGSATQSFSNSFGNQNEQLAQLQTQIAQNRIQTAAGLAQARTTADLQRLGQANATYGITGNQAANNNQLIAHLGDLGQTAISNQYQRQLAGAENSYNTLAGSAGLEMQNTGLTQNMMNSQYANTQNGGGMDLGSMLGTVGGAAAGSLAGGPVGMGIGASLGSQLFR